MSVISGKIVDTIWTPIMATVKIIHYTSKVNSDGTSPIIIQVYDGKKYKRTLANVTLEQWDNDKQRVKIKSHRNYGAINLRISEEYTRLEKLIIENKLDIARDFIQYFDSQPIIEASQLTLRQIADLYLEDILKKSGWTHATFSSIINKFFRIVKNEELLLRDIDASIMKKWIDGMIALKNGDKTIHNNIKVLRFVSEYGARNKHDTKPEALHSYKASTGGRSYKQRLSPAEFLAFRDFVIKDGLKKAEIRDMFLLAVYLRGIRISDVIQLKEKYFTKGRLKYSSQKTDKTFDIKLIPEAIEIIERYKNGSEYLFSFYNFTPDSNKTASENEIERVKHIKSITSNINGKLKIIAKDAGITKNISTHIARHTFARMALEKIKDTNITMDLLGHSSIKVHEAYIREISLADELDAAADDIFK